LRVDGAGYSIRPASDMPFANNLERDLHFERHGPALGAKSAIEYEVMADTFMTRPLTLTMRECIRPNQTDRVRINVANHHFGVGVVASAVIQTYYIAPLHRVIRRGGIAQFFDYECKRTDL
jgi:hypothetical protein